MIKEPEERGWIPADASSEHPVADLVSSVMSAGAKFAGALDGYSWPPEINDCAGTLVRLKRAHGYLEHALAAAEFCGQHQLVEAAWLADVQREITSMVHECDLLIGELRAQLKRGSD
jgi:hypothetical protein